MPAYFLHGDFLIRMLVGSLLFPSLLLPFVSFSLGLIIDREPGQFWALHFLH